MTNRAITHKPPQRFSHGRHNPEEKTLLTFLFSLLVLCLTSLPYFHQSLHPLPGTAFSGFFAYPKDMQAYFMWLHQASVGHWLFRLLSNPPPHSPGYFNSCWNLFGHLAGLLHLSLPAAFQLARCSSGLLLFLAFGWLVRQQIQNRWIQHCITFLFGLGGSVGGLLLWLGRHWLTPQEIVSLSADLWSPIHPFFSIAFVPHFAFALAWFLLANGTWFAGRRSGKRSFYLLSTACIAMAGLTHPFEMLTFGATLILFTGSERATASKRTEWRSLLPLLGIACIIVYYLWLTRIHPAFRVWRNASGGTRPLGVVLLGGGPILWLGLAEWLHLSRRFRTLSEEERWFFCWGALSVFLIYSQLLPNAFGFSTSLLLPHFFLAAQWLERRSDWKDLRERIGLCVTSAVLTLTSALLLWQAFQFPHTALSRDLFDRSQNDIELIFVPSAVKEGMQWLGRNLNANATVFGAWETLLQIPTYADAYVFVGHKDLSSDRYRKKLEILQFFDARISNEWRKEFLHREKIDYVFWGPKERGLGAFRPESLPLLRKVYVTQDVSIYAVVFPEKSG